MTDYFGPVKSQKSSQITQEKSITDVDSAPYDVKWAQRISINL